MSETQTAAPPKLSDLGKNLPVVANAGAVVPLPQTQAQMMEFAAMMSKGGPMIGKPFRNEPGACLGIAMQAWRWNMDPFSCSQKAYLVNEVISYEAQLVHAIVMKNAPLSKRPRVSYSGDGETRRCKVIFHVIGEDEPLEYESPEKKDIKPQNSPLWKTDADQQLWYYSVRAGARRHFPEILMGVYTPEEASEIAAPAENRIITLSGSAPIGEHSQETVIDADFSDGTAVLAKNAKKRKPKEEEPTKAETPPPPPPQPAPPPPQEPAKAAVEEKDDFPSDEEIVAKVEADLKAAPRGTKAEVVKRNRAVLERIREMSDGELFDRADRLLEMFELD